MCFALERVDQTGRRAFFIARMRATCRHRAAGASLRTVLATIGESPSHPTRAFRRLGPWGASRRTLPSANAGHSDWRSPAPTVFRCGSSASEVVRFAATLATELRAAMRRIEDPSRRSETRYVLRTYATRSGAVFGTNDRLTGSHRLSSLSSLSIAVVKALRPAQGLVKARATLDTGIPEAEAA